MHRRPWLLVSFVVSLVACSVDHTGLLEGDAGTVDATSRDSAPQDTSALCVEGSSRRCGDTISVGVCRPGEQTCFRGTWGTCQGSVVSQDEVCDADGLDENCDGDVNEGCPCTPGETFPCGPPTNTGTCVVGLVTCGEGGVMGSCIGGVLPTSDDCDGLDNDCDGENDNDSLFFTTFYADMDGDTFGEPDTETRACAAPAGFVAVAGDCDDSEVSINDEAPETCNGLDDDCNGLVDDGLLRPFFADTDNDEFGDPESMVMACEVSTGVVDNDDDCDDGSALSNPDAPEICDGLDNDCDGEVDEVNGLCRDGCNPSTFNEHVYLFCNAGLSWDDARTMCASFGDGAYSLVVSDNAAETAFLASVAGRRYHIGLGDAAEEGVYVWVDGTVAAPYTNWRSTEPNGGRGENCVTMEADGEWFDLQCDRSFAYICESVP